MSKLKVFDNNIFTFFYYLSPFWVLTFFLFLGLLTFLICPKTLYSIKYKNQDVGFLRSYNWSIILPFMVPFAMFFILSFYQSIPNAITNLVSARVISTSNTSDTTKVIESLLLKNDLFWIFSLFIITILINLFDFLSYFRERDTDLGETKEKDWTVAYQKWNINSYKISKRQNLLFDLFMYSQQWFISFVAFVFIYKLIKLISLFFFQINDQKSLLKIKINYFDVYNQYGFWGLNSMITFFLVLVIILLSFFTIIRFVHVARNVKWSFFPRYVAYFSILLFVALVFSFYGIIDKKLEIGRDKIIVELLDKKDAILNNMNQPQISENEVLVGYRKIQSIESNISLALKQNVLKSDSKIFYFFMAIFLIQLRLIVFPPKSWMDALKNLLKDKS